MAKATGHKTSTYGSYELENKLLQKLGEEMDIIISSTVQSKNQSFY